MKKILVIDDEKDNASVFSIALEDIGLYEVNSFTNPITALSSFKPNTYDLAILDIKMPKMNGFELYEKMKNIFCFLKYIREQKKKNKKKLFKRKGEQIVHQLLVSIFLENH